MDSTQWSTRYRSHRRPSKRAAPPTPASQTSWSPHVPSRGVTQTLPSGATCGRPSSGSWSWSESESPYAGSTSGNCKCSISRQPGSFASQSGRRRLAASSRLSESRSPSSDPQVGHPPCSEPDDQTPLPIHGSLDPGSRSRRVLCRPWRNWPVHRNPLRSVDACLEAPSETTAATGPRRARGCRPPVPPRTVRSEPPTPWR